MGASKSRGPPTPRCYTPCSRCPKTNLLDALNPQPSTLRTYIYTYMYLSLSLPLSIYPSVPLYKQPQYWKASHVLIAYKPEWFQVLFVSPHDILAYTKFYSIYIGPNLDRLGMSKVAIACMFTLEYRGLQRVIGQPHSYFPANPSRVQVQRFRKGTHSGLNPNPKPYTVCCKTSV